MRAIYASLLLGLLLAWVLGGPTSLLAQGPLPSRLVPDTAQLSPQAAYMEALHPLEVTRHNIANWSDVEIAAMNVAISKAKAGCSARRPETYTGNDLVDLARLCSLGQQWTGVVAAASRYITSPAEAKPQLTEAYVAQTEALLRLKQEAAALASAMDMLKAVPYSTDAGDSVDEALGYMRFVHTADALTLGEARQPFLLAALGTHGATPRVASEGAAEMPLALPALPSVHALYAQGLLLASLQQLANRAGDARASVASLEAALPVALTSDDALLIAAERRRYALLGKPLTGIAPLRSLSMPYEQPPTLPAPGAITAMLLFPDWCASCVHLGPQLPPTVFTVEGHSAYVYALLAQTVPPRKPDPTVTNAAFNPAYAAAMMAETPTVTVAADTLNRFPADDFPLLLLADPGGVLRVLQPVGAQDLQPGGEVDAAIALVGKNFSNPHPATPAQAATPRP